MKRLAVFLFALSCAFQVFAGKVAPTPYTYFAIGNTADATDVPLQGGTVLMGGSTDVDAAFQWMCSAAPAGTSWSSAPPARTPTTVHPEDCAQRRCAANSVATLIIPSVTAANDDGSAA